MSVVDSWICGLVQFIDSIQSDLCTSWSSWREEEIVKFETILSTLINHHDEYANLVGGEGMVIEKPDRKGKGKLKLIGKSKTSSGQFNLVLPRGKVICANSKSSMGNSYYPLLSKAVTVAVKHSFHCALQALTLYTQQLLAYD